MLALNIEGCFPNRWAGGVQVIMLNAVVARHVFARDAAVWAGCCGSIKGHIAILYMGSWTWPMTRWLR